MANNKLLSIVVPTKNRYKYLKYLVELIAGFESDEMELVIQDNSDDNREFLNYLNELCYDFIRYDYIKGQIPMAINSDKAILNSTGEYICFLGDDDGTTRFIIDCAKWMKNNNVEAVKSAEISYFWPDITQGSQKEASSVLRYKPFTGKISYLSAYDELLKILKDGIPNRGNMPLVYHSIVRRDVLNRIYDKVGTFFPGNSPDISNAVALSLVVKKFALINYPLAFSGWSVFHGGGVHATGKKGHPGLNDVPWFRPNAERNWDKKVPRIAAGTMIWADSAISALKSMGEQKLYSKINFGKLYAHFVLGNPQYRAYVDEVCDDTKAFKFELLKSLVLKYSNALWRRIGWMTGIKEKASQVYDVDDVITASSILENIVAKYNSPFLNRE